MERPTTEAALRADVEALTRPGERVCGGRGHAAARRHLLARLSALALAPYRGAHEWPYGGGRFVNLLATLPGATPGLAPVLLAAHYDTCGRQPGADDNAAAVAILLEVARRLRGRGLARDVVLAFFDAEEPPHFLSPQMGSTYFYRAQRAGPIHCAIVLDLCGHDVPIPGCEDLLFITGAESDPGLESVVRDASATPGVRTVATLTRYIGDLSDYHAFRVDRRPYLFLTCARWEHYHMPSDTPEKLNYGKMAAIAAFVERATIGAGGRPLDGPFEGYDTTPLELELLRENMAPVLGMLGLRPRGRADIDRLIPAAMGLFGV
ncbi:MAG: M28 family peptidase [Myxococcales bacterium]|nr:M28 family peptidase [Myxococcales bacterium]